MLILPNLYSPMIYIVTMVPITKLYIYCTIQKAYF